ncbi:hypothetical protein EVAR_31915_1 [Eumeta japonica]|uniref:Uncharacterized protein n=1 Tax=Eumeta variegata TaxID=151549 RepID=A0A4C1XP23_EUMVA|nr:hypothetical protein EVAR_31915_1 [Eumeta japonica]
MAIPTPAPSTDPGYHIVSKYQDELNEQTRWVASFNYGVPMATFQLHQQTLVTIYQRTRQEELIEPKVDGVASFNYGVPMATSSSINRPWLPYSIKVLSRRIKRAQTRWGCVV